MFAWIAENLATILISVVILTAVFLVVRKIVRDKKKGKPLCGGCSGGDCSACPLCHKN